MTSSEWQFDGLIGPTHNYAGLSPGNVASLSNAGEASNPREAALQGLKKMWFVKGLGMHQAFLPPQPRPLWRALKQLGFAGNKAKMLEDAYKTAPHLLAACYSASSMWVANAATIAPSADTADGRLHLTPANLISHVHRALEVEQTHHVFKQIFANEAHFVVHEPLPAGANFADEGAANHMRVCQSHGAAGTHVFVYGTSHDAAKKPAKFPARQRLEAFEAIARNHQLTAENCVFVQQHPDAIDAGVFHHDVIGMNTANVMIHHEKALLSSEKFLTHVRKSLGDTALEYIEIAESELSLNDAVKSYFFNAQLLQLPDGGFVIVAPTECEETPSAHAVLSKLESGNSPVQKVHYLDVRQSMKNGGGPACLRLRVVLNEAESQAMHQGIILTENRYEALKNWVNSHYRDRLTLKDMTDPKLAEEIEAAYMALAEITGLSFI